MGLRFQCSKCNEIVFSKFLNIGEEYVHQKCGGKTIIPEEAELADTPPADTSKLANNIAPKFYQFQCTLCSEIVLSENKAIGEKFIHYKCDGIMIIPDDAKPIYLPAINTGNNKNDSTQDTADNNEVNIERDYTFTTKGKWLLSIFFIVVINFLGNIFMGELTPGYWQHYKAKQSAEFLKKSDVDWIRESSEKMAASEYYGEKYKPMPLEKRSLIFIISLIPCSYVVFKKEKV